MAGKAIQDLFKYMDDIADQKGAALVQMEKLRQRQRAGPMVLKDLREQHIMELQQRLGKQRDITTKLKEQQAEQGRAPEPQMDPIPIRASSIVAPGIAGAISNQAYDNVAGGPQPAAGAGVNVTGAQVSSPGAGPVPQGAPTSTQVITEQGTEPGWRERNYGHPGINLAAQLLGGLTGGGGPRPVQTQRTVDVYERALSPMQQAQLDLERKRVEASTFLDIARTFPAAQIPQAGVAMREYMQTGTVSPENTKGLTSLADQDVQLKRSNYAREDAYRQSTLELRRAEIEADKAYKGALIGIRGSEAKAKVAASGAQQFADSLRSVKLMGDIEAKNRENLKDSGMLNPFNLLSALGGNNQGFKSDTIDQFQTDFALSKREGTWAQAGQLPKDLQPGEVKLLSDRAANFNYVLVGEGKPGSEEYTFGLMGYDDWMRSMATLNAKNHGLQVSNEAQLAAAKRLKDAGLIEVKDNKVGPVGKGPLANQSQRLWDGYDYLAGTKPWQQAVAPLAPGGFTGPALQPSSRVGLTPEQLRAQELKLQADTLKAFQLLRGVPEAQLPAQ